MTTDTSRYGSFLSFSGRVAWRDNPLHARFNHSVLTTEMITGYQALSRKGKGQKFENVLCVAYRAHGFEGSEEYRDLQCLDTRETIQAKVVADWHGGPPKIANVKLYSAKKADVFVAGIFDHQTGLLYHIFELDTFRLLASDGLYLSSFKDNFEVDGTTPVPLNDQRREITLSDFIKISQQSIDLTALRPDLYIGTEILTSKRRQSILKNFEKSR